MQCALAQLIAMANRQSLIRTGFRFEILAVRLADSLANWLTGQLAIWLAGWLVDWLGKNCIFLYTSSAAHNNTMYNKINNNKIHATPYMREAERETAQIRQNACCNGVEQSRAGGPGAGAGAGPRPTTGWLSPLHTL